MITFNHHLPITKSMIFEACFKESLRLGLREKREIILPGVGVWMSLDGKLIGETYGICPVHLKEDIPGISELHINKIKSLYVYSTAILPKYRGNGYARMLKAYFIGYCRNFYKHLIGHAREGASLELNKRFGAKVVRSFDDWYGTGETYRMYCLDL